mgnify:CR=1 FL=1
MSNENLKLWESVSKTDPKYTKVAKKGAFHFTSIAPIYQFREATRVFGIQGIGWGVVVGSEKFQKETFEETVILTYDATLFFTVDGVRGEIPIHAQEKACYRTQGANGYLKIDDEVRKKVVTNAKTKGLSELGFNADVFIGDFDNAEYRDLLEAGLRLENAENAEKEQEEMYKEFNIWLKSQCETILKIPHLASVKTVIDKNEGKLRDKLKLLQASPEKIQQSVDRLYAAGHKAQEIINNKQANQSK